MVIYCLTSPSFKQYVGQTKNFKNRMKKHISESITCKRKLYCAIRKYGIENFQKNILIECPNDEADFWEKFYIKLFNSVDCGYNNESGGNKRKTFTVSKEARENISKGLIGKKRKPFTEEHLKNMSEAMKGKYDGKNNPFFGKHHTEECLNRIKESLKTSPPHGMTGKKHSEETKRKIGLKSKGRKYISSIERNKRISEAITKWHKERSHAHI